MSVPWKKIPIIGWIVMFFSWVLHGRKRSDEAATRERVNHEEFDEPTHQSQAKKLPQPEVDAMESFIFQNEKPFEMHIRALLFKQEENLNRVLQEFSVLDKVKFEITMVPVKKRGLSFEVFWLGWIPRTFPKLKFAGKNRFKLLSLEIGYDPTSPVLFCVFKPAITDHRIDFGVGQKSSDPKSVTVPFKPGQETIDRLCKAAKNMVEYYMEEYIMRTCLRHELGRR